jgi:hypothetical protein
MADNNWDKKCLDILVENWDNKEYILAEVAKKILTDNPGMFYLACKRLGFVRGDIVQTLINECKERGITIGVTESQDVIDMLKTGKIPAIRQIRHHTGIGINEAKQILDKIQPSN